jgi:type IV pilus assembly protein PilV
MDLMKFSSGKRVNKMQAGFTLLEVLVGISILAIGMLAVAQMQITAIEGIDKSDESAIALNLAQREMERIIDMDYSDASLSDNPANNGDLYSTASTDFQDCVDSEGGTLTPSGDCLDDSDLYTLQAAPYRLIYNIKDNTTGAPPTPYKEVVLIVQWKRKGKTYTRTLTFVKSLAS